MSVSYLLYDPLKGTYAKRDNKGKITEVKNPLHAQQFEYTVAKNIKKSNLCPRDKKRFIMVAAEPLLQKVMLENQKEEAAAKETATEESSLDNQPELVNQMQNVNELEVETSISSVEEKEDAEHEEVLTGSAYLADCISVLSGQLSRLDMSLSDIYHFAGDYPRLAAHNAYKVYRRLAEVVQKRADVKIRIHALQEALNGVSKPYVPRTEMYELLKSETIGKTETKESCSD